MSKIGIALSGGGARGISHVGVLQALNEFGIYPDIVSGTSAGALLGALYCKGFTPKEILEIIIKTKFLRQIRLGYSLKGLLSLENISKIFNQYIPENTFECLQIPLVVTTTDIERGKSIHFRSGPLSPAVIASCSLPGLFVPTHYQGKTLVDGAILENLPITSIRAESTFLIGVQCNPVPERKLPNNMIQLALHSVKMALHNKSHNSLKNCDFTIEIAELYNYEIYEFHKAQELFDIGYNHTKALLKNSRILENLAQNIKL